MAEAILTVPDIGCGHCERRITADLGPAEGVRAVAVNIPAKRVRVDYDPVAVASGRMRTSLAEENDPCCSPRS